MTTKFSTVNPPTGIVPGVRADRCNAMIVDRKALRRGALNLLQGCAGATAGETLLILHEDPTLGYFGEGLADTIAWTAKDIGLSVQQIRVPFVERVEAIPQELAARLGDVDQALFLARLGDQIRFHSMPRGLRPIVSYALDTEMLASPFGTAQYQVFVELKAAFNALFAAAGSIRVSCRLGTDLVGRVQPSSASRSADVSIKRFPLSVFAPLAASGFAGRVSVSRFLLGTGSQYYKPYARPLEQPVFAHVEGTRIAGWEGLDRDVSCARAHYDFVADHLGVDRDYVHSWHAGIHPGCCYPLPAHRNYERWSGGAFGNPRLLHFHTCGAYAPGEICWNVVDPTIEVDGREIWKDGRIIIDHVPAVCRIVQSFPDIASLFSTPSRQIGLIDTA